MRFLSKMKQVQGRRLTNSPDVAQINIDKNLGKIQIQTLARKYSGKLLTRKEISLNEHTFQNLLQASYFTSRPSIQKTFLTSTCQRCNNMKKSLFAKIPCTKCNYTHYYCRNCIAMGRVMECEPLYFWSGDSYKWQKHKHPSKWLGELTNAQQHAANKINQIVKKGGELLVWAVAGAGKTEMLFPGITTALQQGKRICIATPRADVVRELLPRLSKAFQHIHIQALYSGSRDNDGTAQLIISTTHQLYRYRAAFDVLIIDEIDAFPYHNDLTLQYAAMQARKKEAAQIYLTATPREKLQIQIKTRKLDHVFVPIRFHGYFLPVPVLKKFNSHNESKGIVQFVEWIRTRERPKRQLLIFVPTIKLANELRAPLKKLLFEESIIKMPSQIQSVHAEDKKREEKVIAFRKNYIFVLITTTILERGVTFPSVDVAVLYADHQVFDEAALVQVSGRAGRSPKDPSGEVVFFHNGQTNAMKRSIRSIKQMNQRAKNINSTLWMKGE